MFDLKNRTGISGFSSIQSHINYLHLCIIHEIGHANNAEGIKQPLLIRQSHKKLCYHTMTNFHKKLVYR